MAIDIPKSDDVELQKANEIAQYIYAKLDLNRPRHIEAQELNKIMKVITSAFVPIMSTVYVNLLAHRTNREAFLKKVLEDISEKFYLTFNGEYAEFVPCTEDPQ